jgi:hypothetical protein
LDYVHDEDALRSDSSINYNEGKSSSSFSPITTDTEQGACNNSNLIAPMQALRNTIKSHTSGDQLSTQLSIASSLFSGYPYLEAAMKESEGEDKEIAEIKRSEESHENAGAAKPDKNE